MKNTKPHIKVYGTNDDLEKIKSSAEVAGLSASTYLKNIGVGYKINTVADYRKVEELSKINADLARLGNLLRLVMANDNKVKYFGQKHILKMIDNLTDMQTEMKSIMAALINKRSF